MTGQWQTQAPGRAACAARYKFAGGACPERSRRKYDSETGNSFSASRTDSRDYYAGVYPEHSRRARYYSPRIGRFLSADPLGGAVGNPPRCLHGYGAVRVVRIGPQSLNRYSYVLNDPESLIDPLGLQCQAVASALLTDTGTFMTALGANYTDCDAAELEQLRNLENEEWLTAFGPLGGGHPMYAPLQGSPALQFPGHSGRHGVRQTQAKKGFFTCASDAAESVSIAADLHNMPGLKSGVGGFVANALAGNPISGATNLITSFATGEGGGHNVFYNMALADAASPAQGFGPLFGKAIEATPWAASPTDVAMVGLFGEYATGIGEANLAFSAITYGASAVGCYAGWIQ